MNRESLRLTAGKNWRICCLPALALLFLAACAFTPQQREAKQMAKAKADLEKKNFKRAVMEYKVAAQNMPTDAEPLYQLGMVYLKAHAVRLAVESFERALIVNPHHEGAQYQMALVKVGSSKPEVVEEARQMLTKYLAGHPGDVGAMEALAMAEAKTGNKDRAVKLMEEAEEKNPANMRPAGVMVGYYTAKGDSATAQQIAGDLVQHLPNSPDAAILRAQVSFSIKDFADTDAQITRALALKPDFQPALEFRLRRELMNQNRSGAEQTTQELAKLPNKTVWAAYARMLFAEGKVDQGAAEFNRLLKEHGDDPLLRDEYSRLLIDVGRTSDAAAIVDGTLNKQSKDEGALLQKLTLDIDAGKVEAAAKDAKTLQDLRVVSAELSFQEARLFGLRNQTTRQGDLLVDALRENPRLLKARLELAHLLTASGKPKNALATLDEASPVEKQTPRYIFIRNAALIADNNLNEARKNIDARLAVARSPEFLFQDAVLRLREHDLAGARKSLDSAFQLAPNDLNILRLLGQVMKQQNDGPKFLGLVKDAAAKNPHSSMLQNMLGSQLLSQGDVTGARAAFEASKAAGDVVDADNELAQLDMRSGALDPAKQRLLNLIATHDNARSQLLLAEIEDHKGASNDVVVGHYLKALDLDPSNPLVMNNLANALLSTPGRSEDALLWAQKALSLAPTSPVVEDTVGWIYFKQGKYDSALPYLEKSLKSYDRPVAHYHLAGALLKAGDPTGGRREYELALKQDPKSEARSAVGPLFDAGGSK